MARASRWRPPAALNAELLDSDRWLAWVLPIGDGIAFASAAMKALLALSSPSRRSCSGCCCGSRPGFFFDEIGPYGARNDHYMGDLATWYLALGGVGAGGGAARGLARAGAGARLHPVRAAQLNHLIDVGEADPSWLGPANLVSLVVTSVLLGWMLNAERAAAR